MTPEQHSAFCREVHRALLKRGYNLRQLFDLGQRIVDLKNTGASATNAARKIDREQRAT